MWQLTKLARIRQPVALACALAVFAGDPTARAPAQSVNEDRSAAVDLLLDDADVPAPAENADSSDKKAAPPATVVAPPEPTVVKDPPGVFKIPGNGAGVPSASGLAGRSLGDIAERMQDVAQRIDGPAERRTDVDFEQRRILKDLDLLIAAMNAACKGGQCQPSPNARPGNKPGSKPGNKPGNKPGSGSAAGGGQPQGANGAHGRPVEAPLTELERQQLVDQVWGHLPAAARKQMQQSAGERYHPKYEREIEAYFRRLAEPRATP